MVRVGSPNTGYVWSMDATNIQLVLTQIGMCIMPVGLLIFVRDSANTTDDRAGRRMRRPTGSDLRWA